VSTSVIIVTHNSAAVIEQCCRAALSRLPGAEIIVVDNASSDDTRRLCEGIDGVKLIANDTNSGYGRACNRGADAATSSLLMFLNPDIELRDVDSTALEAESRRVPFGLAAPELGQGHTVQHWFVDLAREVTGPLRPRELPSLRRPVLRRDAWWPAGALLIVDRAEFLALGGFDPRFFLYYEDLDLARRYRAAGLPVRITRAVSARHSRGESSTGTESHAAVRQGWSYLSWLEYLSIWGGTAQAVRAAKYAEALRSALRLGLKLIERIGPLAERAGRKRRELDEIEAFVRRQSGFGEGSAAPDFCPQAREIVAAQ
jgi:N-acetylglucosaminyl-diphospho-decaprenol L-rhamnosyltransferase